MELVRPLAGASIGLLDGLDAIDESFEDPGVVDLCAGEPRGERRALPVYEEVALGAGVAAIYRVGAGLPAPFLAGTLAESTDALDQSMQPSFPSLSSSTCRRRRHTPASCQSRNLRQQVTPLHPNSFGSIRQGIPLLKT